MLTTQQIEYENAQTYFRNWLRANKYIQYLFFLVQSNKHLEVKRINENRYLGIIELYQGKFYLEFYRRSGEWHTDQKGLIPLQAVAPL